MQKPHESVENMTWEDPPPSRKGRTGDKRDRWTAILAELKANPGRWAKFGPYAGRSGQANLMRTWESNKRIAEEFGREIYSFEVVGRYARNEDGSTAIPYKTWIYIRYNPEYTWSGEKRL